MTLSKKLIQAIYLILSKEWEVLANQNDGRSIAILDAVWDLKSMYSSDNRFKNAYEDIIQHYFNNSDWDTDFLFKERLELLSSSDNMRQFIETFLNPSFHNSSEHLTNISALIDYELKKGGLRLIINDYTDEGFPIQQIIEEDEFASLPSGLKPNNIPFFVEKEVRVKPSENEYFLLTPNKKWNDYNVISIFYLTYYKNGESKNIGSTKIISKNNFKTWEEIPDTFINLNDSFCSLGYREEFYDNLAKKFDIKIVVSVLFALQDAGYYPEIHDRFANEYGFRKSLLRNDDSERLLREVRPKLNGANMDNFYTFNYSFKPAYSKTPIEATFNFNDKAPLPDRIYAIIGKNGTGKTQLLSSLPNSLAKANPNDFLGAIPSFSKVIAISYSVFDNFRPPEKNINLNYVYCGLKDKHGENRTSKGLSISFHHNWKKIEEQGRIEKWRNILLNFIDQEIVNNFIQTETGLTTRPVGLTVNIAGYNSIKSKLSSGQSILLYIITEVVANIRLDSLILYDEPETHLHPNAVVELMNTIYQLVNEFQSFCLIATHSPLVIRELFSKNVFVMKRDGDIPSIQRIARESFGENLGILSDEVFADTDVPKQYKKIIRELARSESSFGKIVEALQFDEMPLSLNAKIYIKNYLESKDEKR